MFLFGKQYKWGNADKGISVGIRCRKSRVTIDQPFYFDWAIKNLGSEEKSFVVYSDRERKRYFKLQIFTDKDSTPVQETSPMLEYEQAHSRVTLMLPPLVVKIKPGGKHEFKVFQPALDLAAGDYWLRVSFDAGGVECTSGFVVLSIF